MRLALLIATALALLGDFSAAGPAEPGPPSLTGLGFMAGCWRGAAGNGATIEEYYTPPTDNLILGVSRYTRAGRVTSYEFTTIAREGTGVVLTPRPSGQQPVPFRLTALDSTGATWENPAHDFPTRITYRREGRDSLVARIEGPGGGSTRAEEWRMGRASCG
jgi:hypothetical protein